MFAEKRKSNMSATQKNLSKKTKLNFTEYELQRVPYVGRKTIKYIIEFLDKRGYKLELDPYTMTVEDLDKATEELSEEIKL